MYENTLHNEGVAKDMFKNWMIGILGLALCMILFTACTEKKQDSTDQTANPSVLENSKEDKGTATLQNASEKSIDPLNSTYIIAGDTFTLENGGFTSQSNASNETNDKPKVTVKLIHQVIGDLNGNETGDYAVVLDHNQSGKVQDFYITAMIDNKAINSILLGNQLIITAVQIADKKIIIDYDDPTLANKEGYNGSMIRKTLRVNDKLELEEVK